MRRRKLQTILVFGFFFVVGMAAAHANLFLHRAQQERKVACSVVCRNVSVCSAKVMMTYDWCMQYPAGQDQS